MIQVEGYKAFRGTMQITPKNPIFPQQKIHGDWLYKPEYDCWYGHGQSFMVEICKVITDETQTYERMTNNALVADILDRLNSKKEV